MTIKELRTRYSLTQQELADIIGCSKRNIENWETGKAECKPYIVNLIAHRLASEEALKTSRNQNEI